MSTQFVDVYNLFLSRITDDMYVEMTREDTIRDLRSLLINSIPGFEFPRVNLEDYEIKTLVVREDQVKEGDFVIGIVWNTPEDQKSETPPDAYIEKSSFGADLTHEEINILALLMTEGWLQRQITSVENTRMKYSGTDFKFTSQANHLAKLQSLLSECQRQTFHFQRLYKRRKNYGKDVKPTWDQLANGVFGDYRI